MVEVESSCEGTLEEDEDNGVVDDNEDDDVAGAVEVAESGGVALVSRRFRAWLMTLSSSSLCREK